mgnify:CR=1 FL=1
MSYEDLMNSTMTVQSPTVTLDAVGGEVQTWAESSAGNICRMRLLSNKERSVTGREGNVSTHRLYCLATVTITESDRITNVKKSSEFGADTRMFDVDSVNNVDEDDRVMQVDLTQRV